MLVDVLDRHRRQVRRFLTRAQNRAITIESAPKSSKKLLSDRHPLDTHHLSQHLGEGALGARAPSERRSISMVGASSRSTGKAPGASCTM